MVWLTLVYFTIQTALLSWAFIVQGDWVFPLLAVVNLVAGPSALILWVKGVASR